MGEFSGLFAGLTTIDIQYFVDSFPAPNNKVKTAPPEILVGGPATNAAVAFAYLNRRASLATAIGDNPFSGFIQNDFTETAIQHTDLVHNRKLNPVMATVVTSKDNGNRNIFTHHPETIKPQISPEELFTNVKPDILLLDGFYPEFTLDCARLARQQGIPVVIDGGSWKPWYGALLRQTDVAICSADFLPPGCNTSDEVFHFLKTHGVFESAISRGHKNLLFSDASGRGEVPVEKRLVTDTLGAGDFLHGAFCYFYLKTNLNFEIALKQAVKLASFTCRFNGTRHWLNFTI